MKRILLTFSISFLILPFTGAAQGEQRYASGTATDQENNSFEWINYGTQDWAIENAEVVTYRDGTPIPQVTDDTEWANLTTGAWCYYDNDPTKGKLYNWYAVMGIHDTDPNTPNKAFAPEGWHVPTDGEWTALENYFEVNSYNNDSTTDGSKAYAKAMASTTGWNSSLNAGAPGNDQSLNNSSGFNAFPEGHRTSSVLFNGEGFYAIFWSSTEIDTEEAWYLYLLYDNGYLGRYAKKQGGFSVRFVRDASSVGAYEILLNGTVSAENNQIKNVANPVYAQDAATKNYVDSNVNSFSGSYNDLTDTPTMYTQAQVDVLISSLQDQIDALQSASGSGTVTDQDGNSYPYLTYGDQVWTVKNAEVVTYRDGTAIPQVTDATEWANLTTGAWCYYDNDPSKGKLYNWYAVAGIHDNDENTPNKELAPEGWHVPTDAEWTTLENYLIASGYNYDGTTTGDKIAKSMASTTGWISSTNAGAPGNDQSLNNSSGFNAFPEGYRYNNGSFGNEGNVAIFWSSTENNTNYAWESYLYFNLSSLYRYNNNLHYGFSLRFVRD